MAGSLCGSVVATGTTSTITRRAIVVVVDAVAVEARRVVVVTTGRNVVEVVDVEVVDVVTKGRKVVEVDVVTNGRTVVDVEEVDVVATRLRAVVVVVVRRGRTVVVVTTAGATVDVVVTGMEVVVVVTTAGVAGAAIVTVIDCGEPASEVVVFPAVSAIENEPAAVSVDTTAPPPAVAVEATFSVQTFEVVWTIDEIAEIPAVSTKSELAVVESVAQLMASLPVTVKLIDADDVVAVDAARVTVVGAVRSMVTERDAESGP